MAGISLAAAISELRKQITLSMAEARDEELRFRLGPIELELQVELEKCGEAEAGVKVWVLSIGASGKLSSVETHRVKLCLEPLSGAGRDVEVKRSEGRVPMVE